MAASAGSGGNETAETYGWDTVSAIHIADANAAVARAGSSPSSFQAADTADGYAVSGTFGAWQITTGGSGDLIRLAIPITKSTITKPGGSTESASGTALVDVRLNYLDEEANPPASGTNKLLKVQTTIAGPEAPAASVVQINYTGTAPSFLADAALQGMLGGWLNANLQDFDHVFATVNIDRTADTGAFQWMQPTHVAYAYSDMGTPNDGLLGVLCMTGNRVEAGLPQQISSVVIPPGQRVGFLIAKQRLLENLMLPAMPNVFPGSTLADFKLSTTGEAIVNATNNVSFTVTTAAQGNTPASTHAAQIVDLQLTVEADEMQLSVTTVTDISPGIKAYCQTQSFLGIRLVNKPDGTQTLGFYDSRAAVTNPWTEEDPGIQITEEILGIVALLLAAVAIVVTDGAAIGAAALIVGLVVGVMSLTTTLIQDAGKDDAPSIDSLVLNSTAAITWPDSKDFRLGTAGLSDSLQLGGTLTLAERLRVPSHEREKKGSGVFSSAGLMRSITWTQSTTFCEAAMISTTIPPSPARTHRSHPCT